MSRFDALTFDCYGTLVDWERGIVEAFGAAARQDGIVLDRERVLRLHAEIEPRVQGERYRSYREVLEAVAREAAERLGWPLAPDRVSFLADSLPSWPPFPDTNPALGQLRRSGYRLGILSNVDGDLLRGTLRHLAVPFEFLVTAEEVHAYKPAPDHFARARAHVGRARWMHVAQSQFHDIEPACAQGIPVVWVNRKGESPGGTARPLVEVPDLAGLVAWLGQGPGGGG